MSTVPEDIHLSPCLVASLRTLQLLLPATSMGVQLRKRGGWEQSTPLTKDPNRFPDPATLRRWACRRLLSLWCDMQASRCWWPAWRTIFRAPTILAWDWAAAARNLHLEANSP